MTQSPTGRAAAPTAFPEPGTYGVSQRITLRSATPGASIRYTIDGGAPDESSPVFDPYQLPVLEAVNDGDRGVCTTYTIRAIATAPGLAPSEEALLRYVIDRRAKDSYLVDEVRPGIFMIRDFDDTKIYLIVGSERALLVDAGLGTGNLRALVEGMIGDLPLDVVITHAHPDHIAALGQFEDRYDVYMNHRDLPMAQRFKEQLGYPLDLSAVIDLREGAVFDLGDRRLVAYEVPGHSAGSVVLHDAASGTLIASDAVGSNRPSIPDSLWMQFPGMAPIDIYLSTLQVFRAKVGGALREIYGGHNDLPFLGEAYLDNLQRAAQLLVDQGVGVLVPSLRPSDAWQVVVGDRLTDPNWAAINVARETCLSTPPEQIATLSNIQVHGGHLEPGFTPGCHAYTIIADPLASALSITPTATSGRHRALTLDGLAHRSGEAHAIPIGDAPQEIHIAVTSPDGSVTQTYTVAIGRAAR
jgi:glyoxylase-like metal-dependent hydrolase (beta-lactamase superfamily II)